MASNKPISKCIRKFYMHMHYHVGKIFNNKHINNQARKSSNFCLFQFSNINIHQESVKAEI